VISTLRSPTAERLRPAAAGLGLLALAAVCWIVAIDRMGGMGTGHGAMAMGMSTGANGARALGSFDFFLPTWIVMMAAMMLPAALGAISPLARRGALSTALYTGGYLAVWGAAGIAAFFGLRAIAWQRADSIAVAAVLAFAAVYQLTPFKRACLERCRSHGRGDGEPRALLEGARYGLGCVGCCAPVMLALLALGAMSITWMVVAAVAILAERLLPATVTPIAVGIVGIAIVVAV
jgi:predicted metal-binding membrane protein